MNYPSFTKLWNHAEQQKVGINAVFTLQQAQHEVEEESSAEVTNESKSTPLSEILGDAYDFPQTNLSVKQLLPEWPSNLPAFAEAQKQDVTLKPLWLQADKDSEYVTKEGALHRLTKDKLGNKTTQLVMPTHLRAKVIELAHSTPVTGHIGAEQTKHKIMKNYLWPGMAKEIKQICQSCERCQKVAKHPSKVAPMQKTPT